MTWADLLMVFCGHCLSLAQPFLHYFNEIFLVDNPNFFYFSNRILRTKFWAHVNNLKRPTPTPHPLQHRPSELSPQVKQMSSRKTSEQSPP